jgi:hypothetical protein
MRVVVLIGLSVLVIACADMTGPRPMTLSFEPDRLSLTGQSLADGRMSCNVDAAIQSHDGSPGDSLVLLDIVSTFFNATGARINSVAASPDAWFGTNFLGYNQRATAHRVANGPGGSITIEIVLHYLDPAKTDRRDTLAVACQ